MTAFGRGLPGPRPNRPVGLSPMSAAGRAGHGRDRPWSRAAPSPGIAAIHHHNQVIGDFGPEAAVGRLRHRHGARRLDRQTLRDDGRAFGRGFLRLNPGDERLLRKEFIGFGAMADLYGTGRDGGPQPGLIAQAHALQIDHDHRPHRIMPCRPGMAPLLRSRRQDARPAPMRQVPLGNQPNPGLSYWPKYPRRRLRRRPRSQDVRTDAPWLGRPRR